MNRLILLIFLVFLSGCSTTGTRTIQPNGTEQISVTSGPGGGRIVWPDGASAANGSIVDKLFLGAQQIKVDRP